MSQPARDHGFTLIEVLVTISLMGVLMAFAVSGWSSWARASEQSGTARELQSVLRETQQQAVTEGAALCVTFASTSFTVWRGSCATPDTSRVRLQGPVQVAGSVQLVSTSVPQGVTFLPRGTSTDGTSGVLPMTVNVTRSDSTKTYTLQIERFTGRVSLD